MGAESGASSPNTTTFSSSLNAQATSTVTSTSTLYSKSGSSSLASSSILTPSSTLTAYTTANSSQNYNTQQIISEQKKSNNRTDNLTLSVQNEDYYAMDGDFSNGDGGGDKRSLSAPVSRQTSADSQLSFNENNITTKSNSSEKKSVIWYDDNQYYLSSALIGDSYEKEQKRNDQELLTASTNVTKLGNLNTTRFRSEPNLNITERLRQRSTASSSTSSSSSSVSTITGNDAGLASTSSGVTGSTPILQELITTPISKLITRKLMKGVSMGNLKFPFTTPETMKRSVRSVSSMNRKQLQQKLIQYQQHQQQQQTIINNKKIDDNEGGNNNNSTDNIDDKIEDSQKNCNTHNNKLQIDGSFKTSAIRIVNSVPLPMNEIMEDNDDLDDDTFEDDPADDCGGDTDADLTDDEEDDEQLMAMMMNKENVNMNSIMTVNTISSVKDQQNQSENGKSCVYSGFRHRSLLLHSNGIYRNLNLVSSSPSLSLGRRSMSPITKSTQRMPKSMQVRSINKSGS